METYKKPNFPEESIILLKHSYKSILIFLELNERGFLVESFCLLRSILENILMSLAISDNKDLYTRYKSYMPNSVFGQLKKKQEKELQKNPKYKPPKNKKIKILPKEVRDIISKNHNKLLPNYFDNDTENSKEILDNMYSYYCSYVHPSIIEVYTYEIQKHGKQLESIKKMYESNIYNLSLILISAYSYITGKGIDMLKKLITYIILFNISLVGKPKEEVKILEEYKNYLYLNIKTNFMQNKIKELQNVENELKNIESSEQQKEQYLLLGYILNYYNILEKIKNML